MTYGVSIFWRSIVLALFGFILAACGVGDEQGFKEAVEVNSKNIVEITVSSANDRVKEGETETYTAYGIDGDGNQIDISSLVNWSSSDTSIITVDNKGVATGVSNDGSAEVIATLSDLSASKTLRSSDAALESIEIRGDATEIPVCQSQAQSFRAIATYAASATYAGKDEADISDKVVWTSSNPAIIRVENDGSVDSAQDNQVVLSGLSLDEEGKSELTASQGDIVSDSIEVSVIEGLDSIVISSSDSTLYANENANFTALGDYGPETGVDITANVQWLSSDSSILSFSETVAGQANMSQSGGVSVNATCDPGGEGELESNILSFNVEDAITVDTLRIEIGDDQFNDGDTITLELEDGSAQLELYLVLTNGDQQSDDLADEEETVWGDKLLISGEAPDISSSGRVTFDAIGEARYTVLYKDDDNDINVDIEFDIKVE